MNKFKFDINDFQSFLNKTPGEQVKIAAAVEKLSKSAAILDDVDPSAAEILTLVLERVAKKIG